MTSRNKSHHRSGGGNHKHLHELRGHVDAMRHDLREMASSAGDLAIEQLGPMEEYVRAKPVKSLVIAAGLGAIVGFLFRRR